MKISKRSAQLLAVQLCDNEMPSEWVRTDIKVVSCDFIESSQRWNIFVRMVFEHGDVIIFDVWVSPSGEDMDLTWSAI